MTVSGIIGLPAAIGPGTACQAMRGPGAPGFAAALVLLGAASGAVRGQRAAEPAEGPAHRPASPASAAATSQVFAGFVPWGRTRRTGVAAAGGSGRRQSRPPRGRKEEARHE